jgi:hypothetical protein
MMKSAFGSIGIGGAPVVVVAVLSTIPSFSALAQSSAATGGEVRPAPNACYPACPAGSTCTPAGECLPAAVPPSAPRDGAPSLSPQGEQTQPAGTPMLGQEAPAVPGQVAAPQPYPPQAYPPAYQAYPAQAYPPQAYPPAYPAQGYPAPAYPPSAYPGYYPGYPPPAPTIADSAPVVDPGVHRHDGFFMQMQLGMASFAYKPTPQRTPSGLGVGFDFTIGGALSEHLLLGGGFSMTVGGTMDSGPGYTSMLFGFSGDLIYYLPSNFFVGCAVGIGGMSADESQQDSYGQTHTTNIGSTGPGIFVKAQLGYEWWVSANWALGFAMRGTFVRATEENAGPYAPVWTGGTGALLLSATFD